MRQPLAPGAAFDLHSLDALKRTAARAPQQALHAAAQQVEGLFVQMMLKSMRDATFQGGPFDSASSRLFTSLYDQQIAQNIAAQGRLGFADLIARQGAGAGASPAHPLAANAQTMPLVPGSSPRVAAAATAPRDDDASPAATAWRPSASNHLFLSRLLAPAMAAARHSGIPHQLIVAQAALESGWGKHEILTPDGRPSHNLFGIKATPDWKGESTDIVTTEYSHGVAQRVKAAFRVYRDYAEALTDYIHFLTDNPRYQKVMHSESVEKAAHALQASGYASDPDYAKKLINIIRQVEKRGEKSAQANKSAFDALF